MRAGIIGAVLLAACVAAGPSQARLWKPTPQQLAVDYLTLVHNRDGTQGRVTVSWVASPAINGAMLQQVLDKYVVISVVHAYTEPDGSTNWDEIAGVQVTDGANRPLKEVAPDAIPPVLAGFTASASASVRQSTQGKGKIHWAVYEAGSITACQPGKLLVTYDGETYSFDTPIPGCEKK